MKRLAAHRFHRIEALEVKASPAVKGLSAHTVAAADVFYAHTAGKLTQYLLSNFVCDFHGLKTKPGYVYACPGFFCEG